MNNALRQLATLTLPLALFACGGDDALQASDVEAAPSVETTDDASQMSPSGTTDGDFDREELQAFRDAIPKANRLRMQVPGGTPDPDALTAAGDATLANLAINSAVGVNKPAVLLVSLLRTITLLPPSAYNREEQEYVWGPWDNDDGYGKVLAYIKQNPEDSDFAFVYALIRLDNDNEDSATPVIWGGATPQTEPDEEGDVTGTGVTLWDFEADSAFEKQYDPSYDPDDARAEGRFVMLFGRGDNGEGTFKFNLAVFRDFVAEDDQPDADPANLDYFYGHFRDNDGTMLDFVDWQLAANLCGDSADACFDNASEADLASGQEEVLGLRAAFLNRGMGRAEARVSEGDLPSALDIVECWNDDIDTSYFGVSEAQELVAELGACPAPLDASLTDLGIPSLDDVDPDILAKMDCVATNGMLCEDK